MWSKDLDGWNALKKELDGRPTDVTFREREVWWCSIGVNVGAEQDGHNERYERPVLILKRFSAALFWGVPISTSLKRSNRYYFIFRHECEEYAAIISQLRILDSRRLVRKFYTLPHTNFYAIGLRIMAEVAEITKDSQY